MITLLKLEEYEEYHGFYDGFFIQKVKNGINITNDDEWYLINSLIQDIRIEVKGLASRKFSDNLNKRLEENCDSENTLNQLKYLASKEW